MYELVWFMVDIALFFPSSLDKGYIHSQNVALTRSYNPALIERAKRFTDKEVLNRLLTGLNEINSYFSKSKSFK